MRKKLFVGIISATALLGIMVNGIGAKQTNVVAERGIVSPAPVNSITNVVAERGIVSQHQ